MTDHFSNEFNFKEWTEERLTQVEQGLKHGIDAHAPAQLGEAMRYAVLDGGKFEFICMTVGTLWLEWSNLESAYEFYLNTVLC